MTATRTRGSGVAHIARAALESIAYQTRDVVDAMSAESGTPLAELRIDGGASANNLLAQFQADLLGVPVALWLARVKAMSHARAMIGLVPQELTLEMFETVINLKPESEWRPGMTTDKLIAEMDKALQFPGVSNAWTMPIKARIDMLSTGIRTPIGVKVFGGQAIHAGGIIVRQLGTKIHPGTNVRAGRDLRDHPPEPLVQVNLGNNETWDTHQAAFPNLRDYLLPPFDRALSALLDDLDAAGLLAETLVVVGSDITERLIELMPRRIQPPLRRVLRITAPLALGSNLADQ